MNRPLPASAGPGELMIGLDIGGTKIACAVLDGDGATLHRARTPTPGAYPELLAAIANLVATAEATVGARSLSIGVGTPGSLSPVGGRLRNSNTTWLNGKPFKADIEAALGRSIEMANDANCLTVSEAIDGAGKDGRLVFGVILGTGCGGGLAWDMKVWPGRNGIAGEWGHTALPNPTEEESRAAPCWCGRQGCLETWLSGPAVRRLYQLRTGRMLLATQIADAARLGGDTDAAAEIDHWLDRLARALAGVVNLIDPDVIVFGGGLSGIAALYDALPLRIAARVFSDSFTTPLRQAAHGDASGVRGAAWLWREAELPPVAAGRADPNAN